MKTILKLLICICLTCSSLLAEPKPSIRIGGIFSLSGFGAHIGNAEMRAVFMARDEINKAGGIAGQPLELIIEDNRSDLKTAVTAFQKLASVDQVTALIGPNFSEFVESVFPLASKFKLPAIAASGYKEGLFENRKFIFTLWPPHQIAIRPLSSYIAVHGHSRLSVLVSENAYFQGLAVALGEQLRAAGLTLTTLEVSPGTSDFRSSIVRIKREAPDGVVSLLLETGEQAAFLKQSKELELKLPVYAANTIMFDPLIAETPAVAEGLIYFDYVTTGDEQFKQEYQRRFAEAAGISSAKAYDAVFILKQAIEKCGRDPEKLATCISQTDYRGRSGRIRFDKNGVIADQQPNTSLFTVKDGRFIELAPGS